MKDFFTDREIGLKKPISEKINFNIYNGIITIFKSYNDYLAKEFPIYCEDSNGSVICGFNQQLFISKVRAFIPDFKNPLNILYEIPRVTQKIDTFSVLDFIELCYSNINDIKERSYHSYHRHYDLIFDETKEQKFKFKEEINTLFSRNGLNFYLNENGKIERHLPIGLEKLVKNFRAITDDLKLNELINQSLEEIKHPLIKNRTLALEKIWDAFERMKTYYQEHNKKNSANKLITEVSKDTTNLDIILTAEFKALTEIGNSYHIRHFERSKNSIGSLKHIDYFYYRMLSLIDLCISYINQSK